MSNREILAKNIAQRFVAAISGEDKQQWINCNPEDRIYVGKLSPQSKVEDFSSSVLIKQISVEFKIRKTDISKAILQIYPQGNFFYRVIPTYEQQRTFFVEDFNNVFNTTFQSVDEMLHTVKEGSFTDEMKQYKAQLIPIYEKIAIDRNNVFFTVNVSKYCDENEYSSSIPNDDEFYSRVNKDVEDLCRELVGRKGVMPCQFREKVTLQDIASEEDWEKYKVRQIKREDFNMLPRFNYSLAVNFDIKDDYVLVTIALSNETRSFDETAGYGTTQLKNDKYRINTLFNSGIKVKCENTSFVPIELDYFADDYKYDKNVYALGNNCNVDYDVANNIIQTTHVPIFYQYRLKTNDRLAVKFDDLINNPVNTLKRVYRNMLVELEAWRNDYNQRKNSLTDIGKIKFQNEIKDFEREICRFNTGVELIEKYNLVKDAFCYMNQAFKNSAKGYSTWRLFQIVFIVSLILDLVAHEKDLMLDETLIDKAKTDDVDILFFPTGGGKTEAFLGVLVFNLFFDRLRGKECGVTAILKYPLRLLSVQQVQRVSNILATAEVIRREKDLGGDEFGLGYFVGEGNTPNKINKDLKRALLELSEEKIDDTYRLLDVCPYCGRKTVRVKYDEKANSLFHVCINDNCLSGGRIPLYMVDDDIYRNLPSVIISTVDKMTAVGFNSKFHNLLCGAEFKCPKHGYTDKIKCLADGCDSSSNDFVRVKMKDPAPTLLIQDELHLIRESLGTYAAHYETFIEYFIHNLSGCNRGIKVIGATATISAYEEQAKHLYWKQSIRFPSESPYLDHNFYSQIDKNDICRIILGYAPFGKAIVNSVAYSLQYLKRVVWKLYQNPRQVLAIDGFTVDGTEEDGIAEVKKMLEDYWIILEYNNVKREGERVLKAIDDPINTELLKDGVEILRAKKMTGDDSFQSVRTILSTIENADSVINNIDFNMIEATSMISHGVDADKFNLMVFYGIPGNTAEYIQAYSRVGRKHPGIVIDIMRPSRAKDQSYLKNFIKFHEYKDILVDAVSINRWAAKAVEVTLPGVVSGLLLNYYLYKLKYKNGVKDISKFSDLQKAFVDEDITASMLKNDVYHVYKCSDDDSAIGKLYKQIIDRMIDKLIEGIRSNSFEGYTYLTEVFDKCYFHVMQSLRDTDKQIIIEVK